MNSAGRHAERNVGSGLIGLDRIVSMTNGFVFVSVGNAHHSACRRKGQARDVKISYERAAARAAVLSQHRAETKSFRLFL
jgi:hypothetical protein